MDAEMARDHSVAKHPATLPYTVSGSTDTMRRFTAFLKEQLESAAASHTIYQPTGTPQAFIQEFID